jgi:hypothetical protein
VKLIDPEPGIRYGSYFGWRIFSFFFRALFLGDLTFFGAASENLADS